MRKNKKLLYLALAVVAILLIGGAMSLSKVFVVTPNGISTVKTADDLKKQAIEAAKNLNNMGY